MKDFASKIKPEWTLRLGLGLMYLYSGYDIFYNPRSWVNFVPTWFSQGISPILPIDTYLRFQGVGEFIIGLLFLAWFFGKWGLRVAAIIATIEMASILLFVGVDLITFRDIGLLGAAIAILIISFKKDGTVQV